jgi:hypothetical protein
MACNQCHGTNGQHLIGCPRYKKPKHEEEDLTEIVRCPACGKSEAKMYYSQMWCDVCKMTVYWCGKCCIEDEAKTKHDQRKHTVQNVGIKIP